MQCANCHWVEYFIIKSTQDIAENSENKFENFILIARAHNNKKSKYKWYYWSANSPIIKGITCLYIATIFLQGQVYEYRIICEKYQHCYRIITFMFRQKRRLQKLCSSFFNRRHWLVYCLYWCYSWAFSQHMSLWNN